MKKIFSILIICHLFLFVTAQKEANIWYFGEYAGIDFNSGEAVAITNSAMDQHEGCATISDSDGNLLFYTDGMKIWNRKHNLMANGSSLNGHISATQSGVIAPHPGNENLYYVFSVDYSGSNEGIYYSLVDMSLDNGYGAVTDTKNVFLIGPSEEKITAVQHFNNNDIWVITHTWDSDSFFAYLITEEGIDETPVISNTGSLHTSELTGDAIGSIKASSDGKKIAICVRCEETVELFDFDNATGILSNPIQVGEDHKRLYGLEFSPDGSKLFVSCMYDDGPHPIYQYDLEAGSPQEINNSEVVVGMVENQHFGALQLAPDQKIYVSKNDNLQGDEYLGVINNPNEYGASCNYVDDGFYLNGRKCIWGLPNFIQSYYFPVAFNFNSLCYQDATSFFIPDPTHLDSVYWDFGDPVTGDQNYSRLLNPSHVFSAPGDYTVTLIAYQPVHSDTLTEEVSIKPLPEVSLGNDTIICDTSQYALSIEDIYDFVIWNNGSTSNSIIAEQTGMYWVEVTDQGCTNSDSVHVSFFITENLDLGSDTTLCPGNSWLIDLGSAHDTYLWHDGSTGQFFEVDSPGTIWAEVSNVCGSYSDTLTVDFYPESDYSIGPDTVICEGDTVQYTPDIPWMDILWSNGDDDAVINAFETGIYWSELTDMNGCKSYDTAFLTVNPLPDVNLGSDTTIFRGSPVELSTHSNAVSFYWSTGETSPEIMVDTAGKYWVTAGLGGCYASDTILIFEHPGCIVDLPTAFTPNNDGINDVLYIKSNGLLDVHLMIFNRSGEMVFETKDPGRGWDGTCQGFKQAVDVYNYYMTASCENGHRVKRKGNVALLR